MKWMKFHLTVYFYILNDDNHLRGEENELGLETLNDRRWSRKFCFHKIIKGFSPSYPQKRLSFRNVQHYQTRFKSTKIIEQIRTRTKLLENSFFLYYIREWLKLGDEIQIIESKKFYL